jgi:hypothetical protein
MKNPHISPKWPGILYAKIDAYYAGRYIGSSNAYNSLKSAKLGFAFAKGLPANEIKTVYDKEK